MTAQTDTMTPAPEAETADERVRVVLVDGRSDRRAVMRQVFEHSGVDATVVAEADSGADAVDLIGQHGASVAVVELSHPLADGLAMVAELRRGLPELAIVVISFAADSAIKTQVLDSGADAYLVKPVSAREVMAAVPSAPAADIAG